MPATASTCGRRALQRRDRAGVDVGHDHRGAVLDQQARQVLADLADAGDADPAAVERGAAPQVGGRRAHALEHPVRGEHGGVARTAVDLGAPGREVGLARHDVHVRDVGADVARGDVPPAERLHEPPVGPQQRLRLVRPGVADDDGLAAAVVQPGERVLVRHAPGQGQDVAQGVVQGGVREEPGTAEGRSERGAVDRDDRPEPGGAVVAHHHLLVLDVPPREDRPTRRAALAGARGRARGRVGAHGGCSLWWLPRVARPAASPYPPCERVHG